LSSSAPEEQAAGDGLVVSEGPAPSAPARPARKKREPITSLADFFGRRSAKASLFLKDLRESGRWEFDREDVQAALSQHAQRDKDFRKTTQLVAAALKERDASFARPVVAFASDAIDSRLADNPQVIRSRMDSSVASGDLVGLVTRALTSGAADPKRRSESANLLLCSILCASYADGLDADSAIDVLLSTLTGETGSSPSKQRAKLIWLGERPRDLKSVLELLAPSARRADELASALTVVESRADAEFARRVEAEAEVVRLGDRVADLERTMVEAKAEIARLEEHARATGVHADHDVRRDRARIAGLLDGQLKDLVVTIDEALSVDPAHVEVAREKAEVVLREIERQVEWLRS
jgi:hypothetical protein